MNVDDAKDLKEIGWENTTLKRLLADAEVERVALKKFVKEDGETALKAGCRSPTDLPLVLSDRKACQIAELPRSKV